MSTTSPEARVGLPEPAGLPEGRPRRRNAPWLIAAAVAVSGAGLAVAVAEPFSSTGTARSRPTKSANPTGLYTVAREDLSSQTEVPATLGYAGNYNVVNQSLGTFTSLPAVGQVVSQRQVLYQVNGAPVVLLYGTTPDYRSLSAGLSGEDVAELNADLVALGDATSAQIPPGTVDFTYWTEVGVEKLQGTLDEPRNGTLSLGQAVFAPTAVRVTAVSDSLGGPAQPGQPVVSATSTTRQVSIALDAAEQSEIGLGDKVTITLPNNVTTPGVVSSVGTVATLAEPGTSSSSPTITVLVDPTNPGATGTWDQAPVNVRITTGTVTDVMVVPVDALLAQPGGAYAVEVVGTTGVHRLVRISLGLVDDAAGLVQVGGKGLAVGQRVVVPKL